MSKIKKTFIIISFSAFALVFVCTPFCRGFKKGYEGGQNQNPTATVIANAGDVMSE